MEYVDRELMEKSAKQLGKQWPVQDGNACLILIVTGRSAEDVYQDAEQVDKIAREHNSIDTLVIENTRKQNDVLTIRSMIYFALKPYTMDITDVAVPPASIADFMNTLDDIARKYNMYSPTFGHAADGNLHTHILMERAGGVKEEDLEKVKGEIYDITMSLGGTITAEHGVGKIRVKNLSPYLDEKAIQIMKDIKKAFDPNNILNPGTILA